MKIIPEDYEKKLKILNGAGSFISSYVNDVLELSNYIVFVSSEIHQNLMSEITQFIFYDIAAVKRWISDKEFNVKIQNYKTVNFELYSKHKYSSKDTILILGETPEDIKSYVDEDTEIIEFQKIMTELWRYTFLERHIMEFCYRNPEVPFISINFPRFPERNYSSNEERIVNGPLSTVEWDPGIKRPWESIFENYKELGYRKHKAEKLFVRPKNYVSKVNSYYFEDFSNGYVTIRDGHRITTNQPKDGGGRTIFFIGECHLFGYGSEDAYTIESFLQELFNQHCDDNTKIENYGSFCWNVGDNSYKKLFELPVKPGDVVVTNMVGRPRCGKWFNLDLTNAFQRPHDYGDNLFIDSRLHYNKNGNKVIAELLFDFFKKNDFFKNYHYDNPNIISTPHRFGIVDLESENKGATGTNKSNDLIKQFDLEQDLEDYKKELYSARKQRIGSIVMNCNPFTNGHRYLIERASSMCDYVYIFVVEEDKSFFTFEDRLQMVKKGTEDIPNVSVLKSGKFVISKLTFEEYFAKADIQDEIIDPSNDVFIFAQHIAPALGITVRFAGEEPNDKITRQYNETMNRILPQFGIEFIEIPRVDYDGDVISASVVRKLLEDRNTEAISKIVPATTLDTLLSKYCN